MNIKLHNKLGFRLIWQMIILIVIISLIFYLIISTQTKEAKKRVYDKARISSLILGTHLDRIVSENLLALKDLQESVSLIAASESKIELIRVIAKDGTILAANSQKDLYKPIDAPYKAIVKGVLKQKQAKSITQRKSAKELVIHFMPLWAGGDKSNNLIGVIQVVVASELRDSSQASLRANRSGYFRKEALEYANKLTNDLQNLLNRIDKNLNYLQDLIENISSDSEIEDVKIFSKDIGFMLSNSKDQKAGFVFTDGDQNYFKVMQTKSTGIFKIKGKKQLIEVISPLYLSKGDSKEIAGAVGIVFSLDQIQKLITSRRNNILIMSLIIIVSFCLLIGLFFKRNVLRPILELIGVTENISKGDFRERVNFTSNDEISELSSAFNKMSDEIQKSKIEIEEWNLKLQDRIEKTTKELEQKQIQLLESEKLASLGVLSSGIAHEINNPLGIILGQTQMLLKRIKSKERIENPQDDQKLLEVIEQNTKRCSDIVKSLLLFARSKDLKLVSSDLLKALDNALEFSKDSLANQKIKIIKDSQGNLPKIKLDPIQIEQVFINIINNACQSMSSGGKITIKTEISSGVDGECVDISFIDTGRGISAKELVKVFDPFFSTKEPGEGVGLGLSISYGIIKAHKGTIEIKSKLGQGTSVIIKLPI